MKKNNDLAFFEAVCVLLGFYALIGICGFAIYDNVKGPKIEASKKNYRELSNVAPAFAVKE